MAVLLGCEGSIELRRSSQEEHFDGTVVPSDVNALKGRFSFDFPDGMLMTGDQLELKSKDGSNLTFIAPSGWNIPGSYPDGIWFVNIDEAGGVKLYNKFDDAMSGEVNGRVALLVPAASQEIQVRVVNNFDRLVGQITEFELNTSREAVDVSELGDEFRQQHATMISGSGQLTCFFDYERRMCDNLSDYAAGQIEMPVYMNQLLLRTQLGSGFWAKTVLVGRGDKPGGRAEDFDDEVWYEFDALVTNVGMSFEPTQPIRSTIQFVTTGAIRLRTRTESFYVLQEDDIGEILLEENQDGALIKEDE